MVNLISSPNSINSCSKSKDSLIQRIIGVDIISEETQLRIPFTIWNDSVTN